jgi:hypothetical protein
VTEIRVDVLRIHTRCRQQGMTEERVREILASSLSQVLPFDGRQVAGCIAVLDWDHRLPSKVLVIRLHVCYEEPDLDQCRRELERRDRQIAERDFFPEFDVPDYAGLPGDELYEVDLTGELALEGIRFVSSWRRDVDDQKAIMAVRVVRRSREFEEVQRQELGRSPSLGDLEAVAWTPPCESGQPGWTLDVWWLTSFDGRMGKGWSFLVDLSGEEHRVVTSREFAVRTA